MGLVYNPPDENAQFDWQNFLESYSSYLDRINHIGLRYSALHFTNPDADFQLHPDCLSDTYPDCNPDPNRDPQSYADFHFNYYSNTDPNLDSHHHIHPYANPHPNL